MQIKPVSKRKNTLLQIGHLDLVKVLPNCIVKDTRGSYSSMYNLKEFANHMDSI